MSREGHPRPALRKRPQRVVASEQVYPTQRQILFNNFEGIITPLNHLSHPFEQMPAHVATFDLTSNFKLATVSPDRCREESSQNEWWAIWNLLKKH